MKNIQGGFYMTFDGIEGCGKSTQVGRLYDRLAAEGYDVLRTKEPGGTPAADEIRAILIKKGLDDLSPLAELFLFEASRAQLRGQVIIPGLRKEKIILSDRSSFSSEAYQGYGGRVDLGVVRELNKIANFGIVPDLSFFVDADVEGGLAREVDKNRFNAKGPEYFRKVRQGFLEMAKEDPERRKVINWVNGGINVMHEEIYRIAKQMIDAKIATQ